MKNTFLNLIIAATLFFGVQTTQAQEAELDGRRDRGGDHLVEQDGS